MPKRPPITPDHYREVYNYYENLPPNETANRRIFRLSRAVYRPDVVVSDETRDNIATQLALGKGALIAGNHPSQHDPLVCAASMYEADIDGLNMFTSYAKDSLFRGPTRPVFESTGCLPVFRRKSYPDVDNHTFLAATERLFDVSVNRLREGRAVAILPEGTRSDADHLREIDPYKLKSGIARVALYAGDENSFILPFGLAYRIDNPRSAKIPPRHAVFAVGDPITTYGRTNQDVRIQVAEGIQSALDQSWAKIDRER